MDRPFFSVELETRNVLEALIAERKHKLRVQINLWVDAKGSPEAFEPMINAFDQYKFALRLRHDFLDEGNPF